MPWNLKDDLAHFKKYTLNKVIIMGRKTYESIGRPLPNRINYVISRTIKELDGAHVFNNLEEARWSAEKHNQDLNVENEIVIIGGGYLFNETLPIVNKLIITKVDCSVAGDIYYPKIDMKKWDLVSSESYNKDSDNDYDFKIEEYKKL